MGGARGTVGNDGKPEAGDFANICVSQDCQAVAEMDVCARRNGGGAADSSRREFSWTKMPDKVRGLTGTSSAYSAYPLDHRHGVHSEWSYQAAVQVEYCA